MLRGRAISMTSKPPAAARITRRFSAPPERLFDVWLTPDQVGVWMLAAGGEMERITIDPHVGGSFSLVVRRGGHVIDHTGEYLAIDRPHRLAFTWGASQNTEGTSRVTIEITPQEAGCEVTLTHQLHPHWADYVSQAEAAWTKMLDRIAAALD